MGLLCFREACSPSRMLCFHLMVRQAIVSIRRESTAVCSSSAEGMAAGGAGGSAPENEANVSRRRKGSAIVLFILLLLDSMRKRRLLSQAVKVFRGQTLRQSEIIRLGDFRRFEQDAEMRMESRPFISVRCSRRAPRFGQMMLRDSACRD